MNCSPEFFLFCDKGTFFVYNLNTQKTYEVTDIDVDSFKALSSEDKDSSPSKEVQKLRELGFFYSNCYNNWEGSVTSQIAHKASRIYSFNTTRLTPEEFANQYTSMSNRSSNIPERFIPEGKRLTLPSPSLESIATTSLAECFMRRGTSREFNDLPVEFDKISTLLYSCFGLIHEVSTDLSQEGFANSTQRRSSPSSTGLASCDCILWVNHVDKLEKGLYFYDRTDHSLIKLNNQISPDDLAYNMLDQYWSSDLAAGFFIINDMRYAWVKDESCRAYIASHQEAGHISQNLLLAATALDLQTWMSGSFRDDMLNETLELPCYRFVSLFSGIGYGSGSMLPKGYSGLLNQT